MFIQQGDQYAIPVTVEVDGVEITPDNCTDVRVMVGNKMISYDNGNGELIYDPINHYWSYPLTEDNSFGFDSTIRMQTAVKFDQDYIYSPVQHIDVGCSIIRELWGNSNP